VANSDHATVAVGIGLPTTDGLAIDQRPQCPRRPLAGGPCRIGAGLIALGRVDPVQAHALARDLDRIAVNRNRSPRHLSCCRIGEQWQDREGCRAARHDVLRHARLQAGPRAGAGVTVLV
jgi:hypothetical protein